MRSTLGIRRRTGIARHRGHDCALHQQVPGAPEPLRIVKACVFGQRPDESLDRRQMTARGVADATVGLGLDERIDEWASSEFRRGESFVTQIENDH